MSTDIVTERVLVLPTEAFHRMGYFQGFRAGLPDAWRTLLASDEFSYRPRGEMEDDPSYKQLIPYMLFQYRRADGTPTLFRYRRGGKQGEARLRQKLSVGVGGHISSVDHRSDAHATYLEGMRRELLEEVVLATSYQESVVGMINDDETDVGKVHLGVVHLFELDEPHVQARESGLQEAGFEPVSTLRNRLDEMESWSRIVMEALYMPTPS